MFLQLLCLAPCLVIAATLMLAVTIITICWQPGDPPQVRGFTATTDRRRVNLSRRRFRSSKSSYSGRCLTVAWALGRSNLPFTTIVRGTTRE